ncbi:transcriptional repressor LexA [Desulfogranum mediterraneum]|uniref:transcriptional repressor LexA n=1 Tax=Desulfogranum mediterraneum TaxID=160661 RepID=UPI0003FA423B|nr:transcriptional repressor LexA [Desulfogranum mediterraneum]
MPPQIPLTPRQEALLDYLRQQINQHSQAPSLRQAAQDLAISHTAVASMLQTLQEKGYLQRAGRYSRTITLLPAAGKRAPGRGREVPIIGRVAAGLPLYAQQEWAGSILVDPEIYRSANLFALRISGDSMKDIGILDGDLAICEPRQFAENGEVVVALIDQEEATVKRFFYHGDHIELVPENSSFQPFCYGLGEVLIQGKVVGIHRGPEQMAAL